MAGSNGSARRWGWHRLAEPWPRRIVRAAGVRPGEYVLDLGAGDGALTAALVAAGAKVLAVEAHPGRAARLRARFEGAPVRVTSADLERFTVPPRPCRVVANPPYALTMTILRTLLARGSAVYAVDLVLPAATVAQAVAGRAPGAARWRLRRGLYVPRTAFVPPPQRDSAVLVVRRR